MNDATFIWFHYKKKLFPLATPKKIQKDWLYASAASKNKNSKQNAFFALNDVQSTAATPCRNWYLSIRKTRSMEPITVTAFCNNSCCLPHVRSLASLYFSKAAPPPPKRTKHTSFQRLIFHEIIVRGYTFNKVWRDLLTIVLFQISCWCISKNFVNRSIFGEDMDKTFAFCFYGSLCIISFTGGSMAGGGQLSPPFPSPTLFLSFPFPSSPLFPSLPLNTARSVGAL